MNRHKQKISSLRHQSDGCNIHPHSVYNQRKHCCLLNFHLKYYITTTKGDKAIHNRTRGFQKNTLTMHFHFHKHKFKGSNIILWVKCLHELPRTGSINIPKISENFKLSCDDCGKITLRRGCCNSWKERKMLGLQTKEAGNFKSRNKKGNR